MPRKRKFEVIRCSYFAWHLTMRSGTHYADGRSNRVDAGRHSLGTKDKEEALARLAKLDLAIAVKLGIAKPTSAAKPEGLPLSLDEGRRLYEQHATRPRVAGGVRKSTAKRYRAAFDKFVPFAKGRGVESWNGVTAQLLTDFASSLDKQGYAHKTQHK